MAANDDALQFLRRISNPLAPMEEDEDLVPLPAVPETTVVTLSDCTVLHSTYIGRHSSVATIQQYFLLAEKVFMNQCPLPHLLTWLFPPNKSIDLVANTICMNITFLQLWEGGPVTMAREPEDIQVLTYRMLERSTELSNVALGWFSFVRHQPPRTLIPHPTASALVQDTIAKPHQKLLEFVLQRAGSAYLRRKDGALYRPHALSDGTLTGFYEYYQEAREYVMYSVTPMQRYAEYYSALTLHPSTATFVTNFLSEIPDPRVPQLVMNRHLFSFQNGVFDASTGILHPYRDLPFTDATARFFDAHVPPPHLACDPMDIPTPHFDKILSDQQFNDETRFWMYAMCGRAFHAVGSLDDWQVCLFIRGVAGSGKSTILKVMQMMYESSNVGALMSDGQSTFADEHLFDKFMVVAMDLDRDIQISTTRMNSMISGESLSVNRKHKIALNCTWSAPLLMASNSQPPFQDVAGNIIRRFLIFVFNHQVSDVDPQLFTKLRTEIPTLLVKMARTYLRAVSQYGTRGLWEPGVLPPQLHLGRRQYLVTTNPLAAFLESEWVEFGHGLRVSAPDLRKFLVQFSRENGERRAPSIGQISECDHGHLFRMYDCSIRIEVNGRSRKTFIDGMQIMIPLAQA